MEILESYTEGYQGLDLTPHTDTQRVYITPPSNRRYHVSQMLLYLYRTEAASVQGVSRIYVTLQRGAGTEYNIAMVDLFGAAVGARGGTNLTADITIYPGDTLRAYTVDTSTGGRISYWITINYDAIP